MSYSIFASHIAYAYFNTPTKFIATRVYLRERERKRVFPFELTQIKIETF